MAHRETLTDSMKPTDLEAAIEFLLMSGLTLNNELPPGRAGNAKLIEMFFSILKNHAAPAIFCDIGANDGSTAVIAKRMFPQARVLSLEANPNIHGMYLKKVTDAGVEYLNLAIAGSDGTVKIFIPRRLSRAYVGGEIIDMVSEEPINTGKSSLLRRDEDSTYDEVEVPGVTLDNLLAANKDLESRRDIALWIDVEGAAYEVLSGATETLNNTSVIFIETEGHRFWQEQKMSDEVGLALIRQGFLPVARDREYGDKQFNTIFVHNSLVKHLIPLLFRGKGAPQPALVEPPRAQAVGNKPKARSYTSIAASLASEIPVYIPTFNNPTYVFNMVSQLQAWNISKIVIVDNNSTYGGMISLLDSLEDDCKVIRLPQNHGPQFLLKNAQNYGFLPELFCVTDPDLKFNPNMPQDFILHLLKTSNDRQCGKVGLALDLEDATKMRHDKMQMGGREYHIWEWEAQFWKEPAGSTQDGNPIFKAAIDTTFALYNKKHFAPQNFYDAFRVAGNYTCKHLPWYPDVGVPKDEDQFYRQNQKFSYYQR